MGKSKYWPILALLTIIIDVNHGTTASFNTLSLERALKQERRYAEFHKTRLKRSLDRMRSLHEQVISKGNAASQSIARSKRDSDVPMLFSPFVQFCDALDTMVKELQGEDGYVLSTTPIADGDLPPQGRWFVPPVRVVHAEAERTETGARVVFDVIHPGPALAARLGTFQFAQARLSAPQSMSGRAPANFLSRVQFNTETKACDTADNFDFTESYAFLSEEEDLKKQGGITVTIDTCGFDKYQNKSLAYEDRVWQTYRGLVKQDVEAPKIQILSEIEPVTEIKRGLDQVVDVKFRLDGSSFFTASVNFYDHETGKLHSLWHRIGMNPRSEEKIRITSKKDSPVKLFDLDVMSTIENYQRDETSSQSSLESVDVVVRLTLTTGTGNLGGRLVLQLYDYHSDYYERRLVDASTCSVVFAFSLPGHAFSPSDLKPTIGLSEQFICEEDGNKVFPREGVNCTIKCSAFGPKIKTISITKTDSDLTPYRSTSYTLDQSAFSIIDVGPASPKNQGSYECVVDSENGRVKKSTTLYTSGFPEMNDSASTLEQFGNGTTRITCTATGSLPVQMTMRVEPQNGPSVRIDNNTNFHRTERLLRNGMVLTLDLPTQELIYPQRELICDVRSDRGYDTKQFFLYADLDYEDYYQPLAAKLVKSAGKINHFKNGTTAITCQATGGRPLDIWFSYGGQEQHQRIDTYRTSHKVETESGNTKTVTLYFETRNISGISHWLYCVTKNRYGSQYQSFDLRKYRRP